MISIIICSRKSTVDFKFSENIKNTIGCNYELIIIDNSCNKYSIFEAYNIGINKSKGALLAFIHDDIFFRSNNWGNIVENIFKGNEEIGLLGVAGAKVKTRMPSGMWNCPLEFKEMNIIQHVSNNNIEDWKHGFENSNFSEVVAIDGVFMIAKRENNLFFSRKLIGFHNYDLNISFECRKKGFKIFVTNEVLIEHFSNGEINNSWYESSYQVHEIYKKILPLKTIDVNSFNFKKLEIFNGIAFLNPFIKTGNVIKPIKVWLRLLLIKPQVVFRLKFLKSIIKSIFKIKHK